MQLEARAQHVERKTGVILLRHESTNFVRSTRLRQLSAFIMSDLCNARSSLVEVADFQACESAKKTRR